MKGTLNSNGWKLILKQHNIMFDLLSFMVVKWVYMLNKSELESQTCQSTIAFDKQNGKLQNNIVEGLDNQLDKWILIV